MAEYVKCKFADIPPGVRFDVPPFEQGQAIEVAWGGYGRDEHRSGALYKRVTDRSVAPWEVTYYRRGGGK